MKVRLDAVIAEIAGSIDVNILIRHPSFADLPRFHRMHFITAFLASRDIAQAERSGGRKVLRWQPSRSLEGNFGVKGHGIRDELERIERPIFISTLADEFSDLLGANGKTVSKVISQVLLRFEMHSKGLLEYRGRKDGLCRFERSPRLIDMIAEAGNTTDFVQRHGGLYVRSHLLKVIDATKR